MCRLHEGKAESIHELSCFDDYLSITHGVLKVLSKDITKINSPAWGQVYMDGAYRMQQVGINQSC